MRLVVDSRCALGEGPLWDPARQALFWLDILGGRLWRHAPAAGGGASIALDAQVTAIGLRAAGGFVAVVRGGAGVLDPDTGVFTLRVAVEAGRPGRRTNDGHVGADGAFWFGTMADDGAPGAGALYRLAPDWRVTRVAAPWGIPNAMLMDGARLRAADSARGVMAAFAVADGRLGRRRTLFAAGGAGWTPDGAALDETGRLWNARWDGWALGVHGPDGAELFTAAAPVQRPTSCAFGGPDLSTLFVTSARDGLDAAGLAAQPHAGGLFALDPGVRGAAPFLFQG